MNKNKGYMFGIVLIAVGILLLVFKFANFTFNWQVIWPLMMIGVGLMLFASMGKDKGVVFPATIVVGIGALFLVHNMDLFPMYSMGDLWPFFPIIVGFAFVVLYFVDKKDSGVLIPASILLIVGAVFLSINMSAGVLVYIVPSVVILIGLIIVFNSFRFKHEPELDTDTDFDFGNKEESEGRSIDDDKSEEIPVTYINEDEEKKDE